MAANIGSGPDIIIGWFDDPHQYPDKLIDMTDLADYLGKKYGGWYDVCKVRAAHRHQQVDLDSWGIVGNAIVYRESHVKAAGFDAIPKDTAGFLKLCQAMKAKGTPAGFALGKAVGDGNNWVHWLLWSHGGKLVDKAGNVAINSPETIAALEYAKRLYDTFVPGTLSWQDPNNNKAFLDGQISLTANGISVYYAAKNSQDPKVKEMAADIQHARFPIGPVGKATELMQITQFADLQAHSKVPAGRQGAGALPDGRGAVRTVDAGGDRLRLAAAARYEKNPIWTVDPKHTVYRDGGSIMLDHGPRRAAGLSSPPPRWPTTSCSTWWPRHPADRRRRRKRPSAPRPAPSVTTRSDPRSAPAPSRCHSSRNCRTAATRWAGPSCCRQRCC